MAVQAISVFYAIAIPLWLIALVFMVSLLRRFCVKKQNDRTANISSKRTLYLSTSLFVFQLVGAISFMIARLCLTLRDFEVINTNVEGLISVCLHLSTACIIIVYTLILYIFIARLYACNSAFGYSKCFYIIIFGEITMVILLTLIGGIVFTSDDSIRPMIQGLSVCIGIFNGTFLTCLFVHSVNSIVKDMGDHDNSDMIDLMCKFTVLLILLIGTSTLFSLLLILYAVTGWIGFSGIEKCFQPFDASMNFLGIYLQFSFTKNDYMKWFGRLHETARKIFTKSSTAETMVKSQMSLDTMSGSSGTNDQKQ